MKVSRRYVPQLERLERRDCPSFTANVIGGNLVVLSNSANLTVVHQASANTYQISDGSNTVTRSGVTSMSVTTFGFSSAKSVDIDLNGGSINNVVVTFLTTGSTSLTVHDGTINGYLYIFGGYGADTVNLGNSGGLTVNDATTVNLFSGIDTLNVNSGVTLQGNVYTSLIENVTLDATSTLGKNALFVAGLGSNTYNLHGTINGSVYYTGGLGSDNFTADGSIGADLALVLLSGNDNVNLSGSIGQDLYINSVFFGGVKTINLGGSIGGNASIFLGYGNDVVNFTGAITGTLNVNLGPGDDTFNFGSAATVGSGGTIDGFTGFDTFNGISFVPANVNVINFDVVNP